MPPQRTARESLLGALGSLGSKLPGLFSDRIDLLSLELQRAGLALALLLMWGMTAVMLLLTAWLGLWGALAAVAVEKGLPWTWAAIGVILINALAAWGAIGMARRRVPNLGLPLTRRHLDFHRDALRPGAVEAEQHEAPR